MRHCEDGVSLVEILVAAFLIGIAIVPLVQLYPGSLGSNVSQTDVVLSAAAIRKTEEIITLLRVRGTSVTPTGTATCADLPNCLLVWTATTELSGSVTGVGWLQDVTVTACQDTNGNNMCDPGERQVRYDTKVTSRP